MNGFTFAVRCLGDNHRLEPVAQGEPHETEVSAVVRCIECGGEYLVSVLLRPLDTESFSFIELDRVLQRIVEKGNTKTGSLSYVLSPNLRQSYYRAKRRGWMAWETADQIACHLGMHPSEIWANWFERVSDELVAVG